MTRGTRAAAVALLSALGAALGVDLAFAAEAERGETIRLLDPSPPPATLDPHAGGAMPSPRLDRLLHDGLLIVKDGAEGAIIPDLAERMPAVSDDGRSVTLKVRDGIRFSNGKEMTIDDVVASFRRMFKVSVPAATSVLGGVVGAELCAERPATCALEGGLVVDGPRRLLTINLKTADPDFARKLASSAAAIVPAETPPRDTGTTPPPGTGPYAVAEFGSDGRLTLIRNPFFSRWNTDARPDGRADEIVREFGVSADEAVEAVLAGKAEWTRDPPPKRLSALSAGKKVRVRVDPAATRWTAAADIGVPPFDDARVRRALDLAVDRDALVKSLGGKEIASPIGARANARTGEAGRKTAAALVRAAGVAGKEVVVLVDDDAVARTIGEALAGSCRGLGLRAVVERAPSKRGAAGRVRVERRTSSSTEDESTAIPLVATRRVEILSPRLDNVEYDERSGWLVDRARRE